ncbi:hypothetical protein [Paraliomyxa miuraensis]|nr:hypothetical protein [Paraliomyxa miuraensis]MCX4246590.1 hypothetical protein [Paraliomyxa miuraensis]
MPGRAPSLRGRPGCGLRWKLWTDAFVDTNTDVGRGEPGCFALASG